MIANPTGCSGGGATATPSQTLYDPSPNGQAGGAMSGRPTVADWLAKVPGLRRKGTEHVGPCPACGTGDDRLRITASGHAFCRVCAPDAAGYPTLLRAAGLNGAAAQPDRPVSRLPLNGAGKLTGRWTARDFDGRELGTHTRYDLPDGRKSFPWTKGVKPKSLPLYRSEHHAGGDLVIVEGEKSADAMAKALAGVQFAAGLLAKRPPSVLGSFGADTLPDGGVLAELAKRTREHSRIYLWADNDNGGREHMAKIAEGLIAAGVDRTDLRLIEWAEAPPKGDAADWLDGGCVPTWQELEKAAGPVDAAAASAGPATATGTAGGPQADRNADGLEAALTDLDVRVRYNTRAQAAEYQDSTGPDWYRVSDRREGHLQEAIAARFTTPRGKPLVFGRETWLRCLNALLYVREVDPFREWLEALPAWDGAERTAGWLAEVFDVRPDPLCQWAARCMFLGAVARTFEPGYALHETVVLVGPQNAGKSTACRFMLPQTPEAAAWFSDGLNLAGDDQRRAEALLGRVIVEASELTGATRAELESLKAFLTRNDDGNVRLAYRRNTETLLRQCIIVGTTNNDQALPNDPSGNRRFVPVRVWPGKRGHEGVRAYLTEHREQLWAEALALFADGVSPRLPPELEAAQKVAAEYHRRRDDILEDRLAEWLATAPAAFTLAAAAEGCGLASSAGALPQRDTKRLGAALAVAGYTKRRARAGGRLVYLWSS